MRRATVRTTHDRPGVVAAALRPDNTAEMSTRVDGRTVVTTIERDSTGGLRTTVDDYVTNLQVAQRVTDTTIQP
ncbi:KEOPS complex Pcc1-like subunit [Halobacteriales archaeon QS_4_69_225]|nr:MAG: KEOPS complex Pcc1-like subunit [Halobacteriales archaeon QS_4_69_225]